MKKLFGWDEAPGRIGEAVVHDGASAPAMILKWIQAEERLSIQNHPSRPGLSKRETWYFVDPPVDGRIITGMNCPVSTPDPEPYLEYTTVQRGDLVEVPAGRIHALTPGSFVLEIQEPHDVTYRIHDWGRGRPLHLREAEASLSTAPIIRHVSTAGSGVRRVIAREEFMIEELGGPHGYDASAAGVLTIVAGARFGESWLLAPGESFEILDGETAIWASA